jgi:hypothetical protein
LCLIQSPSWGVSIILMVFSEPRVSHHASRGSPPATLYPAAC